MRPCNSEELRRDAKSICEQVYSAWDGEVDVIVVLVPKTLGPPAAVVGRTLAGSERYREVLRAQLAELPLQRKI